MSRKVPPWAHSARPTARISTTLTKIADHRVQPRAETRLVQPHAREHRRAAVEDDVALQHREADHDVGRRAGRDHQRAVDADESGRQRQQRRRDGQVREQHAREQRRRLVVDEPVEDAERVALQLGVHGVAAARRRRRRRPDPLLEASGRAARRCRRRRWSSRGPAPLQRRELGRHVAIDLAPLDVRRQPPRQRDAAVGGDDDARVRRRASWRTARSTTRRPPTRMRAPIASASVARRITGITLGAEAAARRRDDGGGARESG